MIFLSYKYLSKKNSTEQSKVVKYRSFYANAKTKRQSWSRNKDADVTLFIITFIDHLKNGGVII